MLPGVARRPIRVATLGGMEPGDYWRKVCAPRIRERKAEIGRSPTNTEIGAYVERETGKRTSRQLVEAWFAGDREPYVSQLFALCKRLEMDPLSVLVAPQKAIREPLSRIRDGAMSGKDYKVIHRAGRRDK
jgi:hypothetical protein